MAIALVGITAWYIHLPKPNADEIGRLTGRFAFAKTNLAASGPARSPLLATEFQHLEAYLSAFLPVGAATADLDGNGLADEACTADPFSGDVWVHPLPPGSQRFASFKLDAQDVVGDPKAALPTGCLPIDANEDGHPGLLVYFWGRTPVIYLRNPGSATLSRDAFTAVPAVAGNARWYTQSITAADVDGDGHLDLVAANYLPDTGRVLNDDRGGDPERMNNGWGGAKNGGRNRLLLGTGRSSNPGEPLFKEDENAFGEAEGGTQFTIATAAVDLDNDQLPEVIFVNDHGADRLLYNRSTPGKVQFTLIKNQRGFFTPKSLTMGQDDFHGMGIDFGDFNRDGHLDWAVSNFGGNYLFHQSHYNWINTGDLAAFKEGRAPFVDRGEEQGLARTKAVPWDLRLADFNNDGSLEVFQSAGFMRGQVDRASELHEMALMGDLPLKFPQVWHHFTKQDDISGQESNMFFTRRDNGKYTDIGDFLDMHEGGVSRGAAVADVDGDGGLDLLVAHHHAAPSFFHNVAKNRGAYLEILFRLPYLASDPSRIVVQADAAVTRPGPASRPAVGATVTATLPDSTKIAAVVDGGSGFGGKSEPVVHYGLGQLPPNSTIKIDVAWRDARGEPRQGTFSVVPGRHTVWLGATTEVAEVNHD